MKTILKKSGDSSSSRKHRTMPETQPEDIEPVEESTESPSQGPAWNYPQYEWATRIPRSQVHEERAQRLSANYGVGIEPSEWHSADGDVFRVEKPVRVRLHRDCHRCQTSFGANNKCPGCDHHYCSKCGRNPPKRTESQKQASRQKREQTAQKQQEFAPIIPDYGLSEPIVVTRPSKTGGQPLVHKTVLRASVKDVAIGDVTIAPRLREFHKKKKYPYGYPGDEAGPNSPTFHECHECHEKFPPNAADGAPCENCSHQKCSDCPRTRRTRVDEEPNLDILRSISSRFEQLDLSGQSQ
ncbi:hypothetical protein AB5N19_11021 [Seiridium cardinale]|uniref:Uncharacterized protein n=1 Tax=Seiridium cardinale TaxID=138064 RepID=A0ABR2XIT4_9PEZI